VGTRATVQQTKHKCELSAPERSTSRAAALLAGVAAVLVCGQPSRVSAQQVEFRPHSGLYVPTQISLKGGTLHVRQKLGVKVGARLTLTFSDRFDVVTGVTYMPGYAMVHGAGKRITFGTGSHVLSGATAARYWLLPKARRLAWEIHTGLGVAFGGQAAYEDLFETSTVSAIIGTMVRYELGRIVSLQLRVQERLLRLRFGPGNVGSSRPPLQVSFGLGFPFMDLAR
jgi:hypothetical protein